MYAKCKFVAQCFVYGKTIRFCTALSSSFCTSLPADIYKFPFSGDSLNSSLVAIVSVDQDVLKAWAASEGIKVMFMLVSVLNEKHLVKLLKKLNLVLILELKSS